RPSQAVDAGQPLMRAVGKLRQLAIEAGGKIVADLAQLVVDDVKVIDEPFRCRGDGTLFPDSAADRAIGLPQDATVLVDTGEQATAAATSAVRPRPTHIQPYTARRKALMRSAAAAMAVGDEGVATTSFMIVVRRRYVACRAERQRPRWVTITSTAPAAPTSS